MAMNLSRCATPSGHADGTGGPPGAKVAVLQKIASMQQEIQRLEASLESSTLQLERERARNSLACSEGECTDELEELELYLKSAGVTLPRKSKVQLEPETEARTARCKTLEDLHREIRLSVAKVSVVGEEALRRIDLLQITLVCNIGGEQYCLLERDRFDMSTSERRGFTMPLRRKVRLGDDWRITLRKTLEEKVCIDPEMQDAMLQVDEESYIASQTQEASSDYPQLQTVTQLHQIVVRVNFKRAERANLSLDVLGLPGGHDFVTREVCADGRQRLHVWCWTNREQERLELVGNFGKYLAARGVDVSRFGKGAMKSLYQFYVEVHEHRESTLQELRDPAGSQKFELLRTVSLLEVRVVAEVGFRKLMLTSSDQYLDDGRRRKVSQLFAYKLRYGENWRDVMPRAFSERLNMTESIQKEVFELDQESESYKETIRWSTGYPIRTCYKVVTVTVRVKNPSHDALHEFGLPDGSSFVSQEGRLGPNQRGRLHVWTWTSMEGESRDHMFSTSYEELCRTLQDVEDLVLQTTQLAQAESLGLDAPLAQSLEKIQACLANITDIDSMIGEVDMRALDSKADPSERLTADLMDFIVSNYTRNDTLAARGHFTRTASHVSCTDGSEDVQKRPSMDFIEAGIDDWGFDFFEMKTRVEGKILQSYGAVLLGRFANKLHCDTDVARAFLDKLASLYIDNPYHNAMHAAQTCHLALWISKSISLYKVQSSLERVSCIIAALGHDVSHFGRNNAFCISTLHPLALLYNDQQVLENMHAATCFKILYSDHTVNMLGALKRQDRVQVRAQIVECILSTDMSEHFQAISKFRVRLDSPDFAMDRPIDRRLLAKMVIKGGDIGHSALPWDLHLLWAQRITQEFYEQGDEERRLGLPVSALCDRNGSADLGNSQRGFIHFVCFPLFEALGSFTDHKCFTPASAMREMEDDQESLASGDDDAVRPVNSVRRSVRRRNTTDSVVQQVLLPALRVNAARWTEDADTVARVVRELGAEPPAATGRQDVAL